MNDIKKHINARRSVRNFDGRALDENTKAQLMSYAEGIENPFGLPVTFKYLETKSDGLSCPVVSGTEAYVGGKIKNVPHANEAFGYTFEEFILFAQSLGLGTVWVGGTMDRAAFEKAMELDEGEIMPCMSPLGYPAKQMSLRETMMRKGVRADTRMEFGQLFFDRSFETPLTLEKADPLAHPLEILLRDRFPASFVPVPFDHTAFPFPAQTAPEPQPPDHTHFVQQFPIRIRPDHPARQRDQRTFDPGKFFRQFFGIQTFFRCRIPCVLPVFHEFIQHLQSLRRFRPLFP